MKYYNYNQNYYKYFSGMVNEPWTIRIGPVRSENKALKFGRGLHFFIKKLSRKPIFHQNFRIEKIFFLNIG